MDYETFFFTSIASVAVFAVCICMLAWHNRRAAGMLWFAGAQVVGLIKLVLQGLEINTLQAWISVLPTELYLLSFAMQWVGLHWFVARRPFPQKRLWIAIGAVLAVNTITFLARIPYTGNVINLTIVVLCGLSAATLWKYRMGVFRSVARVAIVIVCGQGSVAAYRTLLTNLRYVRPGEAVRAHTDPYWLYSLAAAALLASCMAMCEMWLLVTELQCELDRRARTDALTGALNRRSMEEAALCESARSRRYGNVLSIIMVDIDNFKQLNDTRGHAAGDRALQALVRCLSGMLREQDSLARMGGEEFAILLPDTSASAAFLLGERLRQAVADLDVPFETGPIRMTICAGVAEFDPAHDWEEMLRRADAAMYAAKRRGRNLVSARPDGVAYPVATGFDPVVLPHTA